MAAVSARVTHRGISQAELEARRERLLEHVRSQGRAATSCSTRPTSSTSPASGSCRTSDRSSSRRARRRGGRSSCPSSRSSARAPRRPSSGSSRTPSTRGSSTRCGSSRACSPISGSRARSAPTRTAIPGILGYQGPPLERGDGRGRRAARRRDRADDGAQERERDRADPRERPLVRARAPAAAGVHAARRDRGGGEPARRRTRRRSRCSRRSATRSAGSSDRTTASRRATAARSAPQRLGARDRAQHRVRARRHARHRDRRAGVGLQRGARAGDGHRPAERRAAAALRPRGRRAAGRVRRAPPGRHVRRRRRRRHALLRGATICCPYWRQHTGHAIGLRNHEAPFLDLGDHTPVEPGMVFTIEPGVYDDELGGFRHSDTVVVTDDGIEHPDRLPERPREPDAPAVVWRSSPRRQKGPMRFRPGATLDPSQVEDRRGGGMLGLPGGGLTVGGGGLGLVGIVIYLLITVLSERRLGGSLGEPRRLDASRRQPPGQVLGQECQTGADANTARGLPHRRRHQQRPDVLGGRVRSAAAATRREDGVLHRLDRTGCGTASDRRRPVLLPGGQARLHRPRLLRRAAQRASARRAARSRRPTCSPTSTATTSRTCSATLTRRLEPAGRAGRLGAHGAAGRLLRRRLGAQRDADRLHRRA